MNAPVLPPTPHEADGASDVAPQSPEPPDVEAIIMSVVGPLSASLTDAETVSAPASLTTPSTGVVAQVASAQSGAACTRVSRDRQSPPGSWPASTRLSARSAYTISTSTASRAGA